MSIEQLEDIAQAMVAEGKGIIAIDESNTTIKKRFDGVNIECSEENRRTYREMLLTAPNLGDYISGAILYDETLRQSTRAGVAFVETMMKNGILPGIKVDKGTAPLAGFPGELITEGQLAIGWEAHPEDIAPFVHAHPTQSEALGEAFLALAGKPLHAL